MAFHTTLILLGNAMLASNARTLPVQGCDTASSKNASCLCYDAATSICMTAKKYRNAFGSFRRSPISATHCLLSAALVLIQIASNEQYGSCRKPALANFDLCLLSLRELSISWDPAGRMLKNLTLLRTWKLGEQTKEQSTGGKNKSLEEFNTQLRAAGVDPVGGDLLLGDCPFTPDAPVSIMLEDTHSFLETSTSDGDGVYGLQHSAELTDLDLSDAAFWGSYGMDFSDFPLQ